MEVARLTRCKGLPLLLLVMLGPLAQSGCGYVAAGAAGAAVGHEVAEEEAEDEEEEKKKQK